MKLKLLLNIHIVILLIFISLSTKAQTINELNDKYIIYRDRLLNDWIFTSPNVEQFGTNIPAVDKYVDDSRDTKWISWSDGNSNYNHWLGILATEYRLLKNNKQDYQESLKLLLYAMCSIERLDLYSEYMLRKHFGLKENENSEAGFIKYPDDINGFLLRDDVSLGFWMQYHTHFGVELGGIIDSKDGTNTYLSVFRKGVIPKQGMSQDNIIYMLQGLSLVKHFVDNEDISNIELNFENNYIPDYLKSKNILNNNTIYFGNWVDDIVDRLVHHMCHEYPEQRIVLKPKNNFRARPYEIKAGGILSSYWYIINPVTNDLVAEGNGEDMGVWINSYGIAETANFITGKNKYHSDGSERGLNKYIFKTLLYKDFRFLYFGGIPVPDELDDYMIRALASVADINWHKNSYDLLYLLGDKRELWTYEHNPLILFLLHQEKYSKVYKAGIDFYDNDKNYYENLLSLAPITGPSSDYRRPEYNQYWSTSSRLNWPKNVGNKRIDFAFEYAGMDYMFLYNLYRLVFEPDNYSLSDKTIMQLKQKKQNDFPVPEMNENDLQYFYLPPKQKLD